MLEKILQRIKQFIEWWDTLRMGIALAIIGVVVILTGHLQSTSGKFRPGVLFSEMWANVGSELISIAITVLIIDALHQRRERLEYRQRIEERAQAKIAQIKERLVLQLGSKVNTQTKLAAEELRGNGWLEDGTLQRVRITSANLEGIDLRHADMRWASLHRANLQNASLHGINLQGSHLPGANLKGARLGKANLQGANLAGAYLQDAFMLGANLIQADLHKSNLTGARVSDDRLSNAHSLVGAKMPDGTLYDGRFAMEGDIWLARKDGVDTKDAEAMAKWYAGEGRSKTQSLKGSKSAKKKTTKETGDKKP